MLKRPLKLAVILATACAAQAAIAGDITLFSGGDFGGRELTLRSEVRNLEQAGFNDRAASMVVQSGTWEVCVHADFGGECRVYEPGRYRSLDRLNGQVSSLREIAGGGGYGDDRREDRRERRANRRGGLTLFDATNLRGRAMPVDGDMSDLVNSGFNDAAQSLVVERGSWEVCQHRNYGGTCRVYGPGEYNNLERGLQRSISSIRKINNGRGNGNGNGNGYGRDNADSRYEQRGSVELFGNQGFGGERMAIRDEVRNLDMMGFNDRAGSLIVYSGEWEFCQHADFRGQCMTYGPGRYDRLGSLQYGISSMRRVR